MNELQAFGRGFSNLLVSGVLTLIAVVIFFEVTQTRYFADVNYFRDIGWPVFLWLVFLGLTGYLAFGFRTQRNSSSSRACFYLNALSFGLLVGAALYFVVHAL